MAKVKATLTIFLLLSFGFSLMKNFMPVNANSIENCEEFGHIHKYKLSMHSKTLAFQKSSYNECHAGKSIFSISAFPIQTYQLFLIANPFIKIVQSPIYFKNRPLEPHQKPPAFS